MKSSLAVSLSMVRRFSESVIDKLCTMYSHFKFIRGNYSLTITCCFKKASDGRDGARTLFPITTRPSTSTNIISKYDYYNSKLLDNAETRLFLIECPFSLCADHGFGNKFILYTNIFHERRDHVKHANGGKNPVHGLLMD